MILNLLFLQIPDTIYIPVPSESILTKSDTLEYVKLAFSLATLIIAGFIQYKLAMVHKQFNSRMDDMLKTKEESGYQKGKAQEVKDQKGRDDQKDKQ